MSNRLEGKVALVTACTRGIGRAIADLFVDEGAKVYYACRNMETGKAAVEAARARGGQAELVYFEAHDPATHRSMIDECIAKEGRLDVLVNNFGESNPRKDLDITKCTYKEFEKTVCVDLSTVFNACQEALNKAMIKQHSGSIINIGSVAAVCPDRTQVGYGVAKSGINHLSRQMARQVAHAGVRVNVLNPGIIATEAVAKHPRDAGALHDQLHDQAPRRAHRHRLHGALSCLRRVEVRHRTRDERLRRLDVMFALSSFG